MPTVAEPNTTFLPDMPTAGPAIRVPAPPAACSGEGATPAFGGTIWTEDVRTIPAATDWAYEAVHTRTAGARPAHKCFIIYDLLSWEGKHYVGVTVSLRMRIARDLGDARYRPHLGRSGTLLDAIRRALAAGWEFADAFQVRILALASTQEEARRLEAEWIRRVGSMRPLGYNTMPGGLSLGGPCNAKPVRVQHPSKGHLRYESLMQAIHSTNAERIAAGEQPLGLFTVYVRMQMGWPAEEALGLRTHLDRRRERAAFVWRGRRYTSLRALSLAEGVPIATARSKLHRARRAGCEPGHDASQDRRRRGSRGARTEGVGPRTRIVLPHPQLCGETVNAKAFAALSGVPHASVLYRYQQLVMAGRDPAHMPRTEILTALTTDQDRRIIVALKLPDGRVLRDGVRALIRQVLADPGLETNREERIGLSSIRKRLREIPGWPARRGTEAEVRWAFGYERAGRPTRRGCVAADGSAPSP